MKAQNSGSISFLKPTALNYVDGAYQVIALDDIQMEPFAFPVGDTLTGIDSATIFGLAFVTNSHDVPNFSTNDPMVDEPTASERVIDLSVVLLRENENPEHYGAVRLGLTMFKNKAPNGTVTHEVGVTPLAGCPTARTPVASGELSYRQPLWTPELRTKFLGSRTTAEPGILPTALRACRLSMELTSPDEAHTTGKDLIADIRTRDGRTRTVASGGVTGGNAPTADPFANAGNMPSVV